MKVALINKFLNNYTTALYFEEVLIAQGIACQRFRPSEQRKIPSDFDLYFYVDDGTHYVIYPNPKVKKILYIIDTHMGIESDLSMIKFVDFVFCAQKNAVPFIRNYNPRVWWVPLACSEKIHGGTSGHSAEKIPIDKVYDIAFIGDLGSGKRAEILNFVKNHYPRTFFDKVPKEKIGEVYASSKIVLNAAINGDINMRFFEGMCSGALLVTDQIEKNGMEDFQRESTDGKKFFVVYQDKHDLQIKLDYYLNEENAQERRDIAQRGQEFARHHRYEDRWNQIVAMIKSEGIIKVPTHRYYWELCQWIYKKIVHKFFRRRRPLARPILPKHTA
jgi:hypothetical protein